MSQIFVRVGDKLSILVFLFISLSGAASSQSVASGVTVGRESRATTISRSGAKGAAHEPSSEKRVKGSVILTEVEPLLLLLFGLSLFTVATLIKVRLSRVNPAISQSFDPFISGSTDKPGMSS